MANPDHLALLKHHIAAWNEWRKANSGIRPDLRGADLRGADLRGADLCGADLRGANLRGASLHGTIFDEPGNVLPADSREAPRRASLRGTILGDSDGLADFTPPAHQEAVHSQEKMTPSNRKEVTVQTPHHPREGSGQLRNEVFLKRIRYLSLTWGLVSLALIATLVYLDKPNFPKYTVLNPIVAFALYWPMTLFDPDQLLSLVKLLNNDPFSFLFLYLASPIIVQIGVSASSLNLAKLLEYSRLRFFLITIFFPYALIFMAFRDRRKAHILAGTRVIHFDPSNPIMSEPDRCGACRHPLPEFSSGQRCPHCGIYLDRHDDSSRYFINPLEGGKRCSACSRVVPLTSSAGHKCPYCGAYWSGVRVEWH